MQRIFISNMYAGLGGGELCIRDHIAWLTSRGIAVSLALLEHGPFEGEALAHGADVAVLPFTWQGGRTSLLPMIRCIVEARQLLRRVQPDLVMPYTLTDFAIFGLAARSLGIPVMYRSQGEIFPEGVALDTSRLARWFPRLVAATGAQVVCTTRAEATMMRSVGVKRDRVTHHYLSVARSLAILDPPAANHESSVTRFGMFGRIVRWKGHDVFLRAAGRLAMDGVPFEAWIVGDAAFGDGPAYMNELLDLAAQLGIASHVRFLGFRADVPQLMQDCDIVCHASRFEPFGMVIIEAMMAGKPVVASKVRGPCESVLDGQTGLLVDPGDDAGLARALTKLIRDPELRQVMGQAGRMRAEQMFSRDANMERMYQLCQDVIARRPVNPPSLPA